MKVAVTGATGFIGGALARALVREGHDVLALGRAPDALAALKRDGVHARAAELTFEPLRAAFADCDAVVHAAARSSPWGTRQAFLRANVDGTRAVLEACRAAGVRRLLHVSTPSVCFDGSARLDVSEEEPLPARQISWYGESKLAAERLVLAAADAQLQVIVMRPRAVLGDGDTALVPRLVRALRRRVLPIIGDGRTVLDLTPVESVVRALTLGLTQPLTQRARVFHISNGEPVALWPLVTRLAEALGVSAPSVRVPRASMLAVARAMELAYAPFGAEPPLSVLGVMLLSTSWTLSIQRARAELGYTPALPVETAIERILSNLRSQR